MTEQVPTAVPATASSPQPDDLGPLLPPDDGSRSAAAVAGGAGRALPAAVAVATLAAVVLAGFALQAHTAVGAGDRQVAQRAAVLRAARQEALNLTSVGVKDVDGDLKRVQDGATGDFAKDFAAQSVNLRKVLQDNAVVSVGEIKDAGIVAIGERNATVIVIANSTVKNKALPAGTPRTYRMRLELLQTGDGRWQTSKLEFVG